MKKTKIIVLSIILTLFVISNVYCLIKIEQNNKERKEIVQSIKFSDMNYMGSGEDKLIMMSILNKHLENKNFSFDLYCRISPILLLIGFGITNVIFSNKSVLPNVT